MSLDLEKVRKDFPILHKIIYGKPLIYMDSAATAPKPQIMIDTERDLYMNNYAAVHRGVHYLSEICTRKYEESREFVRSFINANSSNEIIFLRSATEAVNLVAGSFGNAFIKSGDEVLISELEHHADIVPWYLLCKQKNATLKVIPMNDRGELILDDLDKLLTSKTRIVCVTHVSNSTGTINPVSEIIEKAHRMNIPVLVDGAQSIQHFPIDVKALNCDFFLFSGHKIFGPVVGVLYGKEELLKQMPPYQGGGAMIKSVSFENIEFNDPPLRFEAGTPNFVGSISLASVLNYLSEIGMENIHAYESDLLKYATYKLSEIEGLKIYGTAANKASVISFLIDGIHHYDLGLVLDKMAIAVRSGMHCCEPTMRHFGITGTVRLSMAFFNTKEEIDEVCCCIRKAIKMFK